MAYIKEIKYFNCFLIKDADNRFHIEESRIKGDFNGKSVDYGVRAHITDPEYAQETRENAMIHSGVYNSRTGVNNLNQFPIDQAITIAVDIQQGSIQKLFAEDQVLNILQEEKVRYVPIDKDIIYTAEGVPLSTASNVFLGDVVAYGTNYGIGKNPESFTNYSGRKYFVDKPKGAVLRLSRDGITEISDYGMRSFFRNNLSNSSRIYTAWDIHSKDLIVTVIKPTDSFTVAFDESVNGWSSFFSYIPSGFSGSIDGKFYTFKGVDLYEHHATDYYNRFYGQDHESYVEFVLNANPSLNKNFLTINYEGSDSWNISNMETDTDTAFPIPEYSMYNEDLLMSAFQKNNNKYYSNLINASDPYGGEVDFGGSMSGIKGYYAKVKAETRSSDYKELFSVSSNYNPNSY